MMTNRGTFARVRQTALQGTALAMLGIGGPALVQTLPQSYNAGIPTVSSGSIGTQFGSANETIFINSSTAVLNWTPTDQTSGTSPINFQNPQTSMTYQGIAGNFTVLNRIVPTGNAVGRAISFNGTVNSRVGQVTGGSVWFYSPGGIILSNTAVFDVGSLLLTARDPIGGGTTITNPNSFAGGGTGETGIYIASGAQIRALAENSYIALVAPIVQSDGAIQINGQAAFVGAEQAQLSINNGLFDIVITTGTDANAAFPVGVRGSVTGPASTATTDPHAIYLVTVPKNVATTALITGTGNIGFATATNASIVNGRVVLSNGYNIAAGQIGSRATSTTLTGDTHITGGNFTSSVTMSATKNAFVASFGGTTPQFDLDLTASGLTSAHLAGRQDGVTLRVGGNVQLTSIGTVANVNNVLTATGGEVLAYTATGGRLNIVGNLGMDASVTAPASTGLVAARGGTGAIFTDGGALAVGGLTTVRVDGIGNSVPVANRVGAALFGGSINIAVNSGDLTLTGRTEFRAEAYGTTSASTTAATATGGTVALNVGQSGNTGRLVGGNDIYLLARGFADYSTVANGANGTGVGGTSIVQMGGASLSVAGILQVTASGEPMQPTSGATGAQGGVGIGGTARFIATGGQATINNLQFFSHGTGSADRGSATGVGGSGTGGLSSLEVVGGTVNSTALFLNTYGIGGNKTGGTTGGGGAGIGGNAIVRVTNGTLNAGNTFLVANGTGGTSSGTGVAGNGGAGFGGGARIDTPVGATGSVTTTNASLNATGTGGNATVTTGAVGGAGTGGRGNEQNNFSQGAYIINQGGTFSLGAVQLLSDGTGGTGAAGGAATGGTSQLTSFGGTIAANGSNASTISANATGGAALSSGNVGGGAGGAATAGSSRASADHINFSSTVVNQRVALGSTNVNAFAIGGVGAAGVNGGAGGVGGAAVGGIAQAFAGASTLGITTTSMYSDTRGFGGVGGAGGTGVGGAGGAGTGGQTGGIGFGTISGPNLTPNTGRASFGNTTILASGSGGGGGSGSTGGIGGLGTGGYTTILARGTPVTFGTLSVSSQGIGGAGGSGTTAQGRAGSAIGGGLNFATSNRFERTERGLLVAGTTLVSTGAQLGPGAPGATATAGWAGMTVNNGDVTFGAFNYNSAGTLPSTLVTPPLTIDVAGGVFGVTGLMTINATGNAVISARDGGTLSAQTLSVILRGNVLPRPTEVAIGTPGTIATSGSQSWSLFNAAQQASSGSFTLQSQLVAGTSLSLQARQASLLNVTAGTTVSIGADDMTIGNVASANDDVLLHALFANSPTRRIVAGTVTAPNGGIYISGLGTIATSTLFAGGDVFVDAPGAITINGSATANALGLSPNNPDNSGEGGLYLFSSDGAITTGDLTGLTVNVQQGELDEESFTPINTPAQITLGNVRAESIIINGIGNVTTGNLTVADVYPYLSIDYEDDEFGGPILFAGALGNLVVGNVIGTDFGLLAAGNNVTAGNLNFTGSVAVTAGQNATIGQVTTGTGANDLFYAGNTSALFNDPLLAPYFLDLLDLEFDDDDPEVPFSPSMLLNSTLPAMGGALSVGNLTTGTVRAAAASATFAGINASQRMSLTTSGLASFNGLAIAPRFDIESGDIAIGNAGGIGNQSTSILNLNALGTLVVIGGTGTSEGYLLSNAEAARLVAATTTINATGAVTVRDLTLRGSAGQQPNLIGSQARFGINASGTLRVEGAVALTGAAATDTLSFSSGRRIEVPTDQGGSLTLSGLQTSSLGGTLFMLAPVIGVATNSILTQMAQDPRYSGRDAALATPSGNRPQGFLQAGRISLFAGNTIAIQNSNTSTLMGGFTAGSGGINVAPAPAAPDGPTAPAIDVRIYGRTTSASGAFVTNGDTLPTVSRSTNANLYTAVSAVNGCLFTATSCAAPVVNNPTEPVPPGPNNPGNPNEPVPISPTVVALVNEATDGEPVAAASVPAIRIVKMLDETAIVEDAQVTDPVAGSANASVWDAGTDDDDDADADSAGADTTPAAPGAGGGK